MSYVGLPETNAGGLDRLKLLAALAYTLGFVGVSLGIGQFLLGRMVSGLVLFSAGGLAFATPFLLKLSRRYDHAALGIVMMTYIVPLASHLLSGQGAQRISPWFAVAPIIALVLFNRKIALRMAALSMLTIITLFLSDTFGWVAYAHPPVGTGKSVFYTASVLLLTVVLLSIFMLISRAEKNARTRLSSAIRSVSHELRTPLVGLTGHIDMLRHSELSPKQLEYVETLELVSNDMLAITTDLIEYYSDKEVPAQRQIVAFDVSEQLQRVSKLYALQAASTETELLGVYEGVLQNKRLGQPRQLRQVLINLTRNALLHAQASKVLIGAQTAPGQKVRFYVSDDGLGIEASRYNQLFESGQHGDDSSGDGLGLTISKDLVKQMGGELKLDSEPGKGCCFSFTLELPSV
ncbi:MAG: HAMP domain-containing sensor histidine kinase [Myxococcota bacterium]|nr:HAMP domain-containing sensor histidine kinase [Myxococcota bacterium]